MGLRLPSTQVDPPAPHSPACARALDRGGTDPDRGPGAARLLVTLPGPGPSPWPRARRDPDHPVSNKISGQPKDCWKVGG